MKKQAIYLTEEQQAALHRIVHFGEHNSHVVTRVRVLLMLDRTGKTDHVRYKRTAEYAGITPRAVYNMRDEFLANPDLESYLNRKKRETPPVPPKIDGEKEAQIIAIACSTPPDGCARWTLKLIAEKAVELEIVDSLSLMTVSRLLKKRNLSLT